MAAKVLFGFPIDTLCINQTKCVLTDCPLQHPRCLSDVCIPFIKSSKCEKMGCDLKHFKKKDVDNEQNNIPPIMGVYRFNLCEQQQNCKNKGQCGRLHRIWAYTLCIKNLNGDCDDEDCKMQHIAWIDLAKKTSKEYSITDINPENICNIIKNCNCSNKHPEWAQELCIPYLKGKCRSIKYCTFKHYEWEELKNNRKLLKNDAITVKPCSKIARINNEVEESKSQPFQLFSAPTDIEQLYLQKMKKTMKEKYNLDLLIILDCTGSMALWIHQAQSTVCDIIQKVGRKSQGYLFRVAFVGYRDFEDKNRIAYHDFTENIQEIKKFIFQQKAEGGGDTAEDVIGGLKKGLKLNISRHPESILCTFLIADSPCHGKQYHSSSISDSHGDKIEEGKLENIMKQYLSAKQNNYFTCIKINSSTDQMFTAMKTTYPSLQICSIQVPENIASVFKYTLKTSIKECASKVKVNQIQTEKLINAKFNLIEFPPLPQKSENYWSEFSTLIKNSINQGHTIIRIKQNCLDMKQNPDYIEGVSSYVFTFFDTTNNRNMIAKFPKELVDLNALIKLAEGNLDLINKLNVDKKKLVLQARKNADARFFSQAYAFQLAKSYRRQCKDIKGAPPIFYTPPVIYKLEEEFMGTNYMYAETFIDLKNHKWKKYSSNARGSSLKYPCYTSFTHFTFFETGGRLMVTDLQGKQNILSDPAIHSDQLDIVKDVCSYGEVGIENFAQGQHKKCNVICQKLNLDRKLFSKHDEVLVETDGEERQIEYVQKVLEIKDDDQVHIICEICDEVKNIKYSMYIEIIQGVSEVIQCQECSEEAKEESEQVCNCCEMIFKYNTFIEFKKHRVLPKTCKECILQCQGSTIKCLYCNQKCKILNQNVLIGGQQVYICKNALKYLLLLNCNKCKRTSFDKNVDDRLTQEQYDCQDFVCKKCRF